MADKIVNRGLQVLVGRGFSTADSFAAIQSVSIDDSTVSFAATDTALNSGGAVTNQADVNFDATPTRSSQTVTWEGTFATTVGNFTIRRIAIHNAAAASVSSSSTTLVAGTDAQSITKTSDFSLKITGTCTLTDNS